LNFFFSPQHKSPREQAEFYCKSGLDQEGMKVTFFDDTKGGVENHISKHFEVKQKYIYEVLAMAMVFESSICNIIT
jgi:hypothetical protein